MEHKKRAAELADAHPGFQDPMSGDSTCIVEERSAKSSEMISGCRQ